MNSDLSTDQNKETVVNTATGAVTTGAATADAAAGAPVLQSIFINGKEYKQSELSQDCINSIALRQDLQLNRLRAVVEVEKIDVLTKHYDEKIEKSLKEKEEKDKKDKKTGSTKTTT